MSETNITQEVISEVKNPEEFQQNKQAETGEEFFTFLTGRELAGFFETAFPMTEQEADLLVNYMEGHGYNLGHKDGKLYQGDICYEERKVKWEPTAIDDVVDAVTDWNFEMMQAAEAEMENAYNDDQPDYDEKKRIYDCLWEDEKVLDALFDRTKYGKNLNDMAKGLALDFISDMASEGGLDGSIKRMVGEMQKVAWEKEGALNESDEFEYQGYHFKPAEKFENEEDFFQITARLRRDAELGMMQEDHGGQKKHDYSRDSFYAASTDKEVDVFLCLENGKEYAPCEQELKEYRREAPVQRKMRDT